MQKSMHPGDNMLHNYVNYLHHSHLHCISAVNQKVYKRIHGFKCVNDVILNQSYVTLFCLLTTNFVH